MKNALKTQPAGNSFVLKPEARPGLTMKVPPKIFLLLVLTVAGIIFALLTEPIPQDHAYHQFADSRALLGIPNCMDVLSNLPFIFIGLAGMVSITSGKPKGIFPELKAAYLLFFSGIFLTGFGSAYYHLAPDNATLLWDRLPMTIAFMAFFAIIIGEFISLKAGRKLLLPLLLVGFSSVLYWYFTEKAGQGDLRFYLLVQFLPILLIPAIMLLFPARTSTTRYTWLVVLAYLVAKIFEICDAQLFALTGQFSGHTLKHLMASLAPLIFLAGLYKRRLKTA